MHWRTGHNQFLVSFLLGCFRKAGRAAKDEELRGSSSSSATSRKLTAKEQEASFHRAVPKAVFSKLYEFCAKFLQISSMFMFAFVSHISANVYSSGISASFRLCNVPHFLQIDAISAIFRNFVRNGLYSSNVCRCNLTSIRLGLLGPSSVEWNLVDPWLGRLQTGSLWRIRCGQRRRHSSTLCFKLL